MSTYGMTEEAHLLSPSPDEQHPGEVDGDQHYEQATQPQDYYLVELFNHNDDKYMCFCSNFHVTVRRKQRIGN